MKIVLDQNDLAPIIEAAVRETLAAVESEQARLNGALSYSETQAAEILGVPKHSLRDLRLAGKIEGRRLGRRVVYCRASLIRLLEASPA